MKKLSDWISFVALLAAIVSIIYARIQAIAAEEQVQIAKQSYIASVEQLDLAKKAQLTAEENFKISRSQLELQKAVIETDNRFKVVIGPDSDANLLGSLSNGQDVTFSLVNGSKNAITYSVRIQSEGLGLFWPGQQPSSIFTSLPLDRRTILVQPNETYRRSFSVWIAKQPIVNAKISIFVNDELAAEYGYTYDSTSNTYLPKRS